jgi:periplasmic divalent cation tolerance protein
MTGKIVILCTCASKEEAVKVARALVDARLAACVNILPQIESHYRWKGAVESAEEWLLLIKSSEPLFEKVRALVAAIHSYEVPELIALPVVKGSTSYLAWLDESLQGRDEA